jgi:sulfatase modifying factor 1
VSNWDIMAWVNATQYVTDAEKYGWSFVHEGAISDAVSAATDSAAKEAPWWLKV